MEKKFEFVRGDEKVHSVVYKALLSGGVVFSVYIPKATGLTDAEKLSITIKTEEK